MTIMRRTIILCFAFFASTVVYAQGNTSEDSQEKVADTAASAAAENGDVTAEVFKALSKLRETIEKARKESEDVLADIPAGQLTDQDKIKERFTTVINGIRSELKKLKPGSDLLNAISNLIVLSEQKIDGLAKLGDKYDVLVKGWEALRSELNTINFEIKENRELLYEQLTEIVRGEKYIIELLKLQRAQQAVSEIKQVVSALNQVRQKLAKWTSDAQSTINLSEAGKAPQ
jgi:Mg2+ and Co2+ transporter CorA